MKLRLRAPLEIQFEITSKCNHRCEYCYYYGNRQSDQENFDEQVFCQTLEKIIEQDIFYLVLTGGEPLLVKDRLYLTIEKLKKKNIEVSLNTNLSLFDEEDISLFQYLNNVLISIPSYKEKDYNKITHSSNYKKVLKNIEKIVGKVPLGVHMVVIKNNFKDVYETGRFFFKNFNIDSFFATPINPTNKKHIDIMPNKEEIQEILDQLNTLRIEFQKDVGTLTCLPPCMFNEDYDIKYNGCGIGSTTMTIDYGGNVKACSLINKNFGNINREPFNEVWQKVTTWAFSMIPKECDFCSTDCGGGCRSRAYLFYGDYGRPDPLSSPSEIKLKQQENLNFDINKVYGLTKIKYRKEKEDIGES